MDNAKHFFDELKKGMQKVDQAMCVCWEQTSEPLIPGSEAAAGC